MLGRTRLISMGFVARLYVLNVLFPVRRDGASYTMIRRLSKEYYHYAMASEPVTS